MTDIIDAEKLREVLENGARSLAAETVIALLDLEQFSIGAKVALTRKTLHGKDSAINSLLVDIHNAQKRIVTLQTKEEV